MTNTRHFGALEQMYLQAPVNGFYHPRVSISEGAAEIEIHVRDDFFHIAGAVHGSVYFKQLDDAAYFAVSSLETEFFVVTTAFTTYITRPVSSGLMRAVGKVVTVNKSQFVAESVVYDSEGRDVARGNGLFVRSKVTLASVPGYDQGE